jgi:Ni/Fe-hydrogenase subunit HybB-like protein
MLTKRLMLQQYGIPFSDFAAVVVGALIVGTVVLIADALPFINKFPGKPLIYNVAWKTIIYVLAAFLVRLAEHLVPLIIKYGSLRDAMARVVNEVVWPHFWVIYLWLSVLLFVYCSLRELIRAVGRDQVLRLFFGIGRA